MTRKITILLLTTFLLFGSTNCALITDGEGSWEACFVIRTKRVGDKPAKVEIKSSIVDKIVNSLIDGEISEQE